MTREASRKNKTSPRSRFPRWETPSRMLMRVMRLDKSSISWRVSSPPPGNWKWKCTREAALQQVLFWTSEQEGGRQRGAWRCCCPWCWKNKGELWLRSRSGNETSSCCFVRSLWSIRVKRQEIVLLFSSGNISCSLSSRNFPNIYDFRAAAFHFGDWGFERKCSRFVH